MKGGDEAKRYDRLRRHVNHMLLQAAGTARPASVRHAVTHVVRAGGKRVRPVLVLLACRSLGGRTSQAIHASVAVELLHSFTLVHDDIMDHAPTRRGQPSVHALWGVDQGILAGDVILGLAYESLLNTRSVPGSVLTQAMTRALLDVCEGQAVDLAFQQRDDVTTGSYFRMIAKKTGALIRLSTTLGGLIASGTDREIRALDRYGHHLGRAFQVRDDLLDVVADEHAFGKIVGGDIREGKKTYLVLRAADKARGADRRRLRSILRGEGPARRRVRTAAALYRRLGVLDDAVRRIRRETRLAKGAIGGFTANEGTRMLRWIADELEERAF